MKKKIMITVSAIIVILLGSFVYVKANYMFMPWEYRKGEVLTLDWYDYKGEIEMYLCSNMYDDGNPGRYCGHVTDRETIKWVITEFMDLEHVTRSRKEVEEFDFPEDWGEYYIIEISQVYSRNEDGSREDGRNLLIQHMYENSPYINTGRVYYYIEATDDLLDYVYNYTDENLN